MRPGGKGTGRSAFTGAAAKNSKKTLRKMAKVVAPYKFGFLFVILLTFAATFFSTTAPYLLGNITSYIIKTINSLASGGAGIDMSVVKSMLITLLACYLGAVVVSYIQQLTLASITQRMMYRLRKQVQEKINLLPLKYFDNSALGDILSRVTNDVETLSTGLQQAIPSLFSGLLTMVAVLAAMLIMSWSMTVLALVLIPVSGFVTLKLMKSTKKYFRGQQESLGELSGFVEESFSGQEMIRAYGQEEHATEKFDKINRKLSRNTRKAQFASSLVMPITSFFSNLGYVGVAVMGGLMVIAGQLEIGNIQTFIQYLRQFRHPIAQLAGMIGDVEASIAAAERIFEFLEEEQEPADPANYQTIAHPSGQVSMEHIRFGYSPDKTLIKDLSIRINSGDKVAIVGPTGAGKTTLVNLMLRFYDIQGGKILIDGVDIMGMRRSDLRALFGMVLQDTWLFKGTIEANIRYGRLGASDEEVRAAAKHAYADEFIRSLDGGYQMELEEDGSNISGGQRQLLTIARALLADPQILILDEATSSVDTRTELLIQKAMVRLMQGRTSFVIAHRLSTIRDAQMILVMEQGDIVETGTHDELLAKDGFYAALYRSQLAGSDI